MRVAIWPALVALALTTGAKAQGAMPCDAFMRNPDNTWVALRSAAIPGLPQNVTIREGSVLRPGAAFLGVDVAELLEQHCKSVSPVAQPPGAPQQPPLARLAEPSGLIDVRNLTCAQLADGFQEDADFLLLWYKGFISGAAKQTTLDVPRIREQMRSVVLYCKANRNAKLSQVVEHYMKDPRR